MKCGEASIKLEEKAVSIETTAAILEKIVGHFLYCRGQIDKPYDQLVDENSQNQTHRQKLQYCDRSTPFKARGNYLFATPLNNDNPTSNNIADSCLDALTESIEKFSLESEVQEDILGDIIVQTNVDTTMTNGDTTRTNVDTIMTNNEIIRTNNFAIGANNDAIHTDDNVLGNVDTRCSRDPIIEGTVIIVYYYIITET